jgi:cellulose synthase/poly-beta-1,6-N-acetylglucosamine synthase-like glycosyltransferase
MLVFAVILALAYALLLLWYLIGWVKMPVFVAQTLPETPPFFTVLVPFHNEEQHIITCLAALTQQDYPMHRTEILLLNDGSTDAGPSLVHAWLRAHAHPQVQLIHLPKSGKKAAIATGVALANGTHIACTDADCTPPRRWLSQLAAVFEQHQPQLVAGPVVFHHERRFIEWFQSLDLLGLMCVTGSGIYFRWQHMANGANIAYPKAVFEAVQGFEGNAHIASGDDLFLVQKIARRWPGGVFFLKNTEATVPTLAMPTLRRFVRQRIRWGSKNAALPEWPVRLSLLLVFLTCWATVLLGVAAVFWPECRWPFAAVLGIKLLADFVFLGLMSLFFKKTTAMRWFLPAQMAHIVYVAGIGIISLFNNPQRYRW